MTSFQENGQTFTIGMQRFLKIYDKVWKTFRLLEESRLVRHEWPIQIR